MGSWGAKVKRESHRDKHFTCIHTSPKSLFQMNNGASEMFQNLTNFTQLTNPPTPTSPQGFLVAQLVKNRPAKQDTPVQSPSWEVSLEKG